MPLTTFISDNESILFSSLDDVELNNLLQELREVTQENWLIKVSHIVVHPSSFKFLFFSGKPALKTYYHVLYEIGDGEYQIINLHSDINFGNSKLDVMNFMLGYLAGKHDTDTRLNSVKPSKTQVST